MTRMGENLKSPLNFLMAKSVSDKIKRRLAKRISCDEVSLMVKA